MSTTLSTVPQKLSKKEIRKQVYERLAGALSEFKGSIKEKRFQNNLKKASKLFASDIAKTIGRKKDKPKKEAKAKKKVERNAEPIMDGQVKQA